MKRSGDPNRDYIHVKATGVAPASFQRQSREEPKETPNYETILHLVNVAQPWS